MNLKAALVLTYTVAAAIYAIGGAEEGKGLGGWLVDMIFQLTDSIATRAAGMLAFVIVALPGWIIAAWLPSKVPSPAAASSPPTLWPYFLVITIAGAAFPWGLHRWLAARDAEDQKTTIAQIDLRRDGMPAADAKFVRLIGYRPLDAGFTVSRSIHTRLKSETSTLALGSRDAPAPAEVVWFYEGMLSRSFAPPRAGARAGAVDFDVPLYGEVRRNGMPRYIESAFKRAGIRLAEPYFQVVQVEVRDGRVASHMSQYEFLPWFGFATGPLALAVVAIIWLFVRRNAPEGAAGNKASRPPSAP